MHNKHTIAYNVIIHNKNVHIKEEGAGRHLVPVMVYMVSHNVKSASQTLHHCIRTATEM